MIAPYSVVTVYYLALSCLIIVLYSIMVMYLCSSDLIIVPCRVVPVFNRVTLFKGKLQEHVCSKGFHQVNLSTTFIEL